ncbi:hypothetical protein [Pseudomonas typographi]|uniref:DUF1484 domain-containing protein n=1 Tax=Pseudomonas typographi TaxID=2715964 RepID=A0ABR7ZAJ9_9PSED|nr:hypothetical protein [Pseudomonas typographi]MBD1555108.1 hypothetical protein [Pseudomonas typographi]MBD1590299.1 hypothetical protein [Pseudomonas typographi]MBD1602392.1 hypothetical protein [Pseudomonas typographi]
MTTLNPPHLGDFHPSSLERTGSVPPSLLAIHRHLTRLVTQEPHLLCRAGLQEPLAHLAQSAALVDNAACELIELSSAIGLIVQLLEAAHTQPLMGDHLRCLLAPLHDKLKQSLSVLEVAL